MTEPDEALLWAREDLAKKFEPFKPYISEKIRNGDWDNDAAMRASVIGYRAGAAASVGRIKELEARVAELEAALKDSVTAMRLLRDAVQKHNAESDTFRSGFPLHFLSIEIGGVRSMLKESDQ